MFRKILITGGAGFLGYHLAKHFNNSGIHVCVADNFSRGVRDRHFLDLIEDGDLSFSDLDLLDEKAIINLGDDFDVIFHLAAIIGVRHVTEKPYEVLSSNCRMLENVITLARTQKNLTRLLFASTSEVYAGTLQHFDLRLPTPEDTPLAITDFAGSRTSYMLSKIMGECLLHYSGVPFTIFRPHNVFGPRMGLSHVIPEQLRNAYFAQPGEALPVFSPRHRRTFCFVDDAVKMLELMAYSHSCEGATLNLGTEAPEINIRELVQMCIEVSGKELFLEEREETPGSPARRSPDMTQMKRLLDFESQVGLYAGIERTWTWYCENVFRPDGLSAR